MKPLARLSLIVAVCYAAAVALVAVVDASRVHLNPTDNAYRGIVVAISPKIKPVLGRQIIPNLEVSLYSTTAVSDGVL